jgi:hypothetical protein
VMHTQPPLWGPMEFVPLHVRRHRFASACGEEGQYLLPAEPNMQLHAGMVRMLGESLGWAMVLEEDDKGRLVFTPSECYPEDADQVCSMEEVPYTGHVYDLTTGNHHFHAGIGDIIVHNTDSLFVRFRKQAKGFNGKEAVQKTIEVATEASMKIKPLLKAPHDLEYEKTYWPFVLFSKKRYVANQYGTNTDKFKQSSMGIVLKRRDNAQIVKHVFGGIIDIILNQHDIEASVRFLRQSLSDLIKGKHPLEDLIISKTLRAFYKDPSKISHKVLADRIKERSPGAAPQVNDRIPYVYVVTDAPGKVLQGDRIEHPDYIREKGLRPDYTFYITNQIMNPVLQIYALNGVLEDIKGNADEKITWERKTREFVRDGKSTKYAREKVRDLREDEVKKILFDPVLKKLQQDPEVIRMKNKQRGNHTITDWIVKL